MMDEPQELEAQVYDAAQNVWTRYHTLESGRHWWSPTFGWRSFDEITLPHAVTEVYTEHTGDFPGTYWLAGTDKPHRCPACWSASWRYATFSRRRAAYSIHGYSGSLASFIRV